MFTNWDILIIVVYAIHYSHSPLCRAFSNEIKRRALRSSPVDKLSSSVHTVSHSLLLFAFHQVGKMKFMLNFIRARERRASTADICYLVVCTTVFDLIRIFFAFAKNFTSFICVYISLVVHWNANQDLFKCFLVAQSEVDDIIAGEWSPHAMIIWVGSHVVSLVRIELQWLHSWNSKKLQQWWDDK